MILLLTRINTDNEFKQMIDAVSDILKTVYFSLYFRKFVKEHLEILKHTLITLHACKIYLEKQFKKATQNAGILEYCHVDSHCLGYCCYTLHRFLGSRKNFNHSTNTFDFSVDIFLDVLADFQRFQNSYLMYGLKLTTSSTRWIPLKDKESLYESETKSSI